MLKLTRLEWVAVAYVVFGIITIAVIINFRSAVSVQKETIEWLILELEYQRQHCICPKLGEEA